MSSGIGGSCIASRGDERVGVIGRTGSGKSTSALFHFMEAREGPVTIDGSDTSKIKLHALRRRLGIVQQHLH